MNPAWLAHLPFYLAMALPLASAALIVILHQYRPEFRGLWPIGAMTAVLVWILVFLMRPEGYLEVPLLPWQAEIAFLESPLLLVDPISWSYAMCLVTLLLGILLTALSRYSEGSWLAWAGTLSLTGLGLIAVWAGNSLTLLLAWAALDILELLVQLFQVQRNDLREGVIVAFSARLAGTMVMILAFVLSRSQQNGLSFTGIPPSLSPFLIIAVGLRLGVLPLQTPLLQEIPLRRGVGTALRLVPAAASLVLLTRTAAAGVEANLTPLFLVLAGIAAFYSGMAWFNSADELSGRPFWMLGMASLAVGAAVRGLVFASLAWGLALLLSGGVLFIHSARNRRSDALAYLGVITASTLPFTPAWAGVMIFSWHAGQLPLVWHVFASGLFLLALLLLLLGYLRHLRRISVSEVLERWVWLAYLPGLAILPLVHFGLGWLYRPALADLPLTAWWMGILVTTLVVAGVLWGQRARTPLPGQENLQGSLNWGASFWGRLLSFTWLYRLAWTLYHLIGRILSGVSSLLEGDGGLLWALLLLVLVYSLFTQGGEVR